ncbi:MAG TPA: TlpA disulfide reductase family protein [Pyrinomonadaceae bacterium]|nr:TlpA disulfide reductase family protein [Pyrinomonadaceae bacterium]
MKFKSILIAYFALHILLFINGKLAPNIKWNFVGSFLVCCFFTIFCIKKFNDGKPTFRVLFTLILLRLLLLGGLDLYVRLAEDLYGSPILIIALLGIISGFFYLRLNSPFNLAPFVFSSIFVAFMFFQGWDYYQHKLHYQSFTGRVEAFKLQQRIEGIDEKGNRIDNQYFENKISLLDFWNTKCGICFEKFPQLQTFYDKYKDDNSIIIYAINKPIEEDTPKTAFQIIKEKGYTFPVLLPIDQELPEKFGVEGYPTTFVINQNSQIVFKGDISGAVKMVEELKLNSR